MPVWHEMLTEDEVWRIILFLYDYTGFDPRSWELESGGEETAAEKEKAKPEAGGGLDEERVLAVYTKRCAHCHGEDGDGLGPVAEFMYPLPRDFTLAVFKYKTTAADDEFPTDDDLRRTIREGLPGTLMPAWKTILGDAEIDGLIRLIKEFGGWDEEEIEYHPIAEGERVPASPESIERGREKFVKACVQCHGDVGRGNVTSGKKLKDDWRNRIWPRNLTRPETWRYTHDAQTIFQRISTGIRGTPMPEHTTTMPENDRWDVANYIMTLRDAAVPLTPGETVVRGIRIDGDLPTTPDDPAWDKASPITFPLVPNIIKDKRLFFSLNDGVTVRVLFNDEAMAMRLVVDDRTYSVPGDPLETRYRLDDVQPTPDAVAVQFPAEIPTTSEKPWFRHGDRKHPVNMWYWRAPSVEPEVPEQVVLFDAAGPDGAPEPRPDQSELAGTGIWREGQWRIVLGRSLRTEDVADLQFETGRYIPVAFADWDGLAGEAGSRHTLTSWYWLLLEPNENPALVYGAPVGTGLIAGLLFVGAIRRQKRRFISD
jgi:DMSO reductase family type II enzyme heme b subunit